MPEPIGHVSTLPPPFRCGLCYCKPRWRLDRIGDAIVTWACPDHLVLVLTDFLPVDKHRDQVTVTDLANRWCETTGGGSDA